MGQLHSSQCSWAAIPDLDHGQEWHCFFGSKRKPIFIIGLVWELRQGEIFPPVAATQHWQGRVRHCINRTAAMQLRHALLCLSLLINKSKYTIIWNALGIVATPGGITTHPNRLVLLLLWKKNKAWLNFYMFDPRLWIFASYLFSVIVLYWLV